ncbi:MAG: hypothetical protein KJ607_11600 [Bacteroidetes bacterium]|nr:hypothetical protein [Bacteroidota bacterium]
MRIFQKQDLIIYLLTVFLTSCNSTIRETGTDSSGYTIPTAKKPGLSQLSDRIRKNPLNAANFAERSRLYFELDNVDEAINDLEIAVKLDSMKPEYYIDLAEYNIYNRKPGAAKDKLEKCISIFPENTEAILKLAELHLYI